MNPTNPNNIFQAAGGVKTVTVEEEVAVAEKRVKAMKARVGELTAASKEAKAELISIKRESMTKRAIATKEELDEAAEEVTKKQKKLKDAQYAQMEGIAKLAVAVMELAEKKEEAKKEQTKQKKHQKT